ncbi:hypothetical protein QO207_30195 [Pseudomonas sp. CAN2814]|uniref:hypothetical protein n=1 Tax=Pseudomonas sp. CAN1 TaxID=3046726 RepID=UPI002649FE30|nr:hypothetical protein [Pseudomonas sp. CAN1]MDN6860884.1 hypothetical protein [Pseudomonas sp. CAN1]
MQLKPLAAAFLIGTAALSGCKQEHKSAATEPAVPAKAQAQVDATADDSIRLDMPALPIIRNAVFSLTPTFDGKRDPQIMAQLCGLARGELTQEQINAFLRQRNVDPAKLPRNNQAQALLVNGDKAGQALACAAYLATSVMLPSDVGEFVKNVEVKEKPLAEAGKTKGKASEKAAPAPAAKTVQQLDAAALAQALPVKLALARTNADIFALIATELERESGLSLAQYRNKAMQLFARLAPVYLQRVKQQMPGDSVNFEILRLEGNALAFRSTDGSRFEFDGSDLRLVQNDVMWFGEGRLLGQQHVLSVAYFDSSVGKLLAPAKP